MILIFLIYGGIFLFSDWYVLSHNKDNNLKSENEKKEQEVEIHNNEVINKPKTSTPLLAKDAYAIIIGISNYPGATADLSYCDDDAQDVYTMLLNDYNFKSENIIYLQDSSATKSAISNAFDQIAGQIDENDIFFFYYSGHGGFGSEDGPYSWIAETPHNYPNYYDNTWSISRAGADYMRVHFYRFDCEEGFDYALCGDSSVASGYYYEAYSGNYGYNFWSAYIPVSTYYIRFVSDYSVTDYGFRIDMYEALYDDGTHYLCSYDSIPDSPSNYYLDTLINSKLDNINSAENYIIIDSCHSGGIIPEVQEIGTYIMTACEDDEASLEAPALQHGVFTNYFLRSLDHASDSNGDGAISMEECYSYTYSNTVSYSGSLGYTHHPEQNDGISGPTVLYPTFGSVSFTPSGNSLSYSFTLYGTGLIEELYLIICNVSQSTIYEIEDLTLISPSATGFGLYSGSTQLDGVLGLSSYGIFAKIQGNRIIYINNTVAIDSDGDSFDDIFEIALGLNPGSNDTDSDGLNDYIEFYGDTNPLLNDTDNDGLLDGLEILTYFTNGTNPDTDGDGLIDGEEVLSYFTNATNSDTEGDGMDDYYEVFNSLDPLTDDSSLDYDNDGLTNILECQLGSSANDPDSDNDDMPDYYEYLCDLNLLVDDTNLDKDHDGLSNLLECQLGSLANDPDSDNDNMPDNWEYAYNLSLLVNDGHLDSDNDGLSNLNEFNSQTNPQDSDTDKDGLTDGSEVYIYRTDPTDFDTDGDGYSDGLEVAWGVDPLNPRSSLITVFLNITGGIILALGSSYMVYKQVIKKKRKKNEIPLKKKFVIDKEQKIYNILKLEKKYRPKPQIVSYQTKPAYTSHPKPKIIPDQLDVGKLRDILMYGLPKPKSRNSAEGQRALLIANMAFESIKRGNYINGFDLMINALLLGVPEPMNNKLKAILLDSLNRSYSGTSMNLRNEQTQYKKCPWCGHLGKIKNKYCYNCGRSI